MTSGGQYIEHSVDRQVNPLPGGVLRHSRHGAGGGNEPVKLEN